MQNNSLRMTSKGQYPVIGGHLECLIGKGFTSLVQDSLTIPLTSIQLAMPISYKIFKFQPMRTTVCL